MNAKTKLIVGLALVAGVLYFARAANASTKVAGATASASSNATDKDSRVGASPVQPSKVAQPATAREGTGFARGISLLPVEPRGPSAAFQNPNPGGKLARYPYWQSIIAAHLAPLRPDYTPTDRASTLSN